MTTECVLQAAWTHREDPLRLDIKARCSAVPDQRKQALAWTTYAAVQVVGFYGTKSVSYQEALAAIFIEGWIFIAISILGIRQRLIGLLPRYRTHNRTLKRYLFLKA